MAWWLTHVSVVLFVWVCIVVEQARLNRIPWYGLSVDGEFRGFTDHFDTNSFYAFDGDYSHSESEATVQWGDAANNHQYSKLGSILQHEDVPESVAKSVTNKAPLSSGVSFSCHKERMEVFLPSGPLSKVKVLSKLKVLGSWGFKSVDVLESCGHALTKGPKHNTLIIPFKDCGVTRENGNYSTKVMYHTDGQMAIATLTCAAPLCPADSSSQSASLDHPHSDDPMDGSPPAKCNLPSSITKHVPMSATSTTTNNPITTTIPASSGLMGFTSQSCNIPHSQKLACGAKGISPSVCLDQGCCVDPVTSACYYPMDECTADKHFVFIIHRNMPTFPVELGNLVVSQEHHCGPIIRTEDFIIFKFSVTDCGTRTYDIADTSIYLAEVLNFIQPLNATYGSISRDLQIKLTVECRYPKGVSGLSNLISTGFMVMGPPVLPPVESQGLYGVQLRIAEDNAFTNFYPDDHPILEKLLGQPVFLEVLLKAATPGAKLLVHYCVAYSSSAKAALVLLYDGCANLLDYGAVTILHKLPGSNVERRLEIKAFQFMDVESNEYLQEEIYFICSTEVCFPSEKNCDEGCYISNN